MLLFFFIVFLLGYMIQNVKCPMYERIDNIVDDGALTTGKFRVTPNGRPTYILEE